jgi:hypothetical protein
MATLERKAIHDEASCSASSDAAPLLVAGVSKDASIQRLDGSSITIVEAQRFAQKTTCMIT